MNRISSSCKAQGQNKMRQNNTRIDGCPKKLSRKELGEKK
jgi:hypothetical protein